MAEAVRLSEVRRYRLVVVPGRRQRRVVGPARLRRRSSGDAASIRSCPFSTGCPTGQSDDGGDVTSLERHPAGDGTVRPFHSALSEWLLGHERVPHRE